MTEESALDKAAEYHIGGIEPSGQTKSDCAAYHGFKAGALWLLEQAENMIPGDFLSVALYDSLKKLCGKE